MAVKYDSAKYDTFVAKAHMSGREVEIKFRIVDDYFPLNPFREPSLLKYKINVILSQGIFSSVNIAEYWCIRQEVADLRRMRNLQKQALEGAIEIAEDCISRGIRVNIMGDSVDKVRENLAALCISLQNG